MSIKAIGDTIILRYEGTIVYQMLTGLQDQRRDRAASL